MLDQADLGGGATHVERQDFLFAAFLRDAGCEDGATSGTGLDEADGKPTRRLQARETATRGHEVDRVAIAFLGEGIGEAREVAGHQGLHVGICNRRRGALVLPRFGAGFARQRDLDARAGLADNRGGAFLVRGIGVGVNEGDRDGVNVAALQLFRDGTNGGFVEREPHNALDVHALGDRKAESAWH